MQITRRAKLVVAVLVIAVVQTWLAMTSFGMAFAAADGGWDLHPIVGAAAAVFGVPALFIAPFFGNGNGIYVAFALGGLLWGTAIVFTVDAVKRRKGRLSPNAR